MACGLLATRRLGLKELTERQLGVGNLASRMGEKSCDL
jgi:hypothetical protein